MKNKANKKQKSKKKKIKKQKKQKSKKEKKKKKNEEKNIAVSDLEEKVTHLPEKKALERKNDTRKQAIPFTFKTTNTCRL